MDVGDWFACANIAVADWINTWNFVKLAISLAISTSRTRDSEAVTFSRATLSELTFVSNVYFWMAPS
jgi:hypothetical protein